MAEKPELMARKVQVFLVDFALTLVGLSLLALGAHAVWNENIAVAGTALTAGLLLLFAATIDRFEFIKGLGIEARTRELNRTIDKAQVTLTQVRKLSELAGANLITLYSSIGRWSSAPTVMEAYAQSRRVKEMLIDIGSNEFIIKEALMPWVRTAASDLLQTRHQEIYAQIVQVQQQLSEAAMHAQYSEKEELDRRISALGQYALVDGINMKLWELSSYVPRLREYLKGAPEPIPNIRRLHDALDKDQIEIDALVKHQDFSNPAYWAEQKVPR